MECRSGMFFFESEKNEANAAKTVQYGKPADFGPFLPHILRILLQKRGNIKTAEPCRIPSWINFHHFQIQKLALQAPKIGQGDDKNFSGKCWTEL